ncbi:MAG: hypothetical protein ACPG8W_16630 [Candidatus Promineifilaceae bacterium]
MSYNPEIGRILRASTAGFAFGCRATQLDIPFFGGLVKAQAQPDECIYGLIYNFSVDDDPLVRRLVMADDLPPSAINDQRTNRMLPVEMSVLSVGYNNNGVIRQGFPPRPPLNLDQVFMVIDPDEIAAFTDQKSYLRLILRSADSGIPVDQLLVAHIRSIYELRNNDAAWAIGVIQEVIELLRSNYETLIPTLEALSDALPDLPLTIDA